MGCRCPVRGVAPHLPKAPRLICTAARTVCCPAALARGVFKRSRGLAARPPEVMESAWRSARVCAGGPCRATFDFGPGAQSPPCWWWIAVVGWAGLRPAG